MKAPVTAVLFCLALGACTPGGANEELPTYSVTGGAEMSREAQDARCAVLTEVIPSATSGAAGVGPHADDRLVAVRSAAISHASPKVGVTTRVRLEAASPGEAAPPREWVLSAPCVVWRAALVSGATSASE